MFRVGCEVYHEFIISRSLGCSRGCSSFVWSIFVITRVMDWVFLHSENAQWHNQPFWALQPVALIVCPVANHITAIKYYCLHSMSIIF